MLVPEKPGGVCVVKGTFKIALFVHLLPEALELPPADALWLIDYGFRMPGVISLPPVASQVAGSASPSGEFDQSGGRGVSPAPGRTDASLKQSCGRNG